MFPCIKKIFLVLSLTLAVKYNAQIYKLSDLDRITKDYKNKGNMDDALKFNLKALAEYRNENNSEGIVASKIHIGNLLSTLNKQKESIEYLDKAKARIDEVKNPVLNTRLYNEYGRNYALLGLYEQSNVSFNKAILASKKISDKEERDDCQIYAYSWKLYNFENLGERDSLYQIQYRNLKLFPKESLVYEKIADRFIREKKNLDSAEYYLKKALPLSKINPIRNILVLQTYGDMYKAKGEGEKALECYFQVLNFYEKIGNEKQQGLTCSRISKVYKELGNTEKENEYLQKAAGINDNIEENERKMVNLVVKNLIDEKEQEKEKEKRLYYILIGALIITALGFIYFIRKRYIKKQERKDKLIEEKSLETQKLEKQVNVSFDEVMNLAKNADPFFLTRFKEVYPDFYEKLVQHAPNLSEHDLKFCAYLRLNLTTKEIAQFENISIRTVESKKYRLKKKMELPAEAELGKWILDL